MGLNDVFEWKISNTASFFVKTIFVLISPLTFPFFGIVLGHTLRVGREVALVVTDDQRQIRECIFFPTPSVGWACASLQRLASPFVCCTSAVLKSFLERSFG